MHGERGRRSKDNVAFECKIHQVVIGIFKYAPKYAKEPPYLRDTFWTNFIVHCEEMPTVWRYHLLLYCIRDKNNCQLFGSVCCSCPLMEVPLYFGWGCMQDK